MTTTDPNARQEQTTVHITSKVTTPFVLLDNDYIANPLDDVEVHYRIVNGQMEYIVLSISGTILDAGTLNMGDTDRVLNHPGYMFVMRVAGVVTYMSEHDDSPEDPDEETTDEGPSESCAAD